MANQPPITADGHWFWGQLPNFTDDSLKFLLKIRQYGDLQRTRFGPFTAYLANTPEYMREVLVTNASHYEKSRVTKQALDDAAGKGLFTNDGESWKRQRKLVQPAFHTQRISAYADVMSQYTDELAQSWHNDEVVDIEGAMSALTMRIAAKTLFDADISEETGEISAVVNQIFEGVNYRFNHLVQLPRWIPTKRNRTMRQAVDELDENIQSFIDNWRREGVDKGDLLSMLLMAQDEDDGKGMSDKQVRDEVVTLFVAGHETTANTLIWMWYLLSINPDVMKRLQEEVDTVLGGRIPTFEDLPKLQYTEMVVKETMRLYPQGWMISRQVAEDTELGGYPIRKGSVVMLNIYGIHRDERYFEVPEQFKPERFSPENEKSLEKYAYLPFGAGPRICIGNAFAMMEAKLVTAVMAQRFSFTHPEDHIAEPERIFTLRTKYGMKLRVHERQQVPVTT